MSRFTKAMMILALLLSGAAAYVGHYAEVTADRFMRDAAYVPPRGVEGPKEPPPGTVLETVTDLEDNPFWGRDGNGALIPKDPERKAKQKASPHYAEVSRFAYAFAKLIPIFAVIVLCFRAIHNALEKRKLEAIGNMIELERNIHDAISHPPGGDPGRAVDSEADRDAGEETPCISGPEQASRPVGQGALVLVGERPISDSGPA